MNSLVIIIAGPSGSGKTPTIETLREKMSLGKECLIWTSRKPRVEKDEKNGISYFFSSKKEILALPKDWFLKRKVHKDHQAVDLLRLLGALSFHEILLLDMFHTFIKDLCLFLESKEATTLTIFLTPVKEVDYQKSSDKRKLIKDTVFENIKKRNPEKDVDPSRLDSAVKEIETAFFPNQTLYDAILDAVPEYVWDQEKNPKKPKNPKIVELLQKIEDLIS